MPGVTNRILSRFVSRMALAFAEGKQYVAPRCRPVVTGNPVRQDLINATRADGARALGLSPDRKTILVTGGSRGAGSFARTVPALVAAIVSRPDLQLIWGTGKEYFDAANRELSARGLEQLPANVLLMPYIYRQDQAMAASDLAVVRAGALTLAELTARGLPSVIIPSPNVTHNHQEKNAAVLARAGAAEVIHEVELTPERLVKAVLAVVDNPDRLRQMGEKARSIGRPEATKTIVEQVLALAHGRSR